MGFHHLRSHQRLLECPAQCQRDSFSSRTRQACRPGPKPKALYLMPRGSRGARRAGMWIRCMTEGFVPDGSLFSLCSTADIGGSVYMRSPLNFASPNGMAWSAAQGNKEGLAHQTRGAELTLQELPGNPQIVLRALCPRRARRGRLCSRPRPSDDRHSI